MSEGPNQPVDPTPAPVPAPTVVTGYGGAGAPPPAGGPSTAGLASLRGQLRTVRYLLFACLVLLVVLMFGLAMALAGGRQQIDELRADVAAFGQQADAAALAAATVTGTTPQATAQPTPQATAAPAPQATGVPQLAAAAALTGVTVPAGADATGALLIGDPDASNVVEVYIDYQCPFCQRWEQTIGTALADRAMQPGSDLLVKQYNLAFLGETSTALTPAGASARAASAAACVIDRDGVDVFVPFSRSLFATADPSEPPGQFTAKVLVDLATKAGASKDALACITAEENVPFVAASTQAGFTRGVGGTPTVIVNGQTLANPFQDATLSQLAAPA